MATLNVGMRISGSVANSVTNSSTSGTLYSCPSNAYAILNIIVVIISGPSVQTADISVGGALAFSAAMGSSSNIVTGSNGLSTGAAANLTTKQGATIYCGPGQSVTYTKPALTTTSIFISGVQISNTI
jgi:hypothetical protein